jgi:hypothetical protein
MSGPQAPSTCSAHVHLGHCHPLACLPPPPAPHTVALRAHLADTSAPMPPLPAQIFSPPARPFVYLSPRSLEGPSAPPPPTHLSPLQQGCCRPCHQHFLAGQASHTGLSTIQLKHKLQRRGQPQPLDAQRLLETGDARGCCRSCCCC